jgi:hypothetical protein
MIETIKAAIETEQKDTTDFRKFYQNYVYKVQDNNINREFAHMVHTQHVTIANLSLLIDETCRNLVILNG